MTTKTLDDLEAAVDRLLSRFRTAGRGYHRGPSTQTPSPGPSLAEEERREAAELVRRALRRLKALY